MGAVPADARNQWKSWVKGNIARPFRKQALKAALKCLTADGDSDTAMAAAMQTAAERADYMATSALVIGATATAAGLFRHGLAIVAVFLAALFAIGAGLQGRRSTSRAWQAWAGIGLALLGVAIFIMRIIFFP